MKSKFKLPGCFLLFLFLLNPPFVAPVESKSPRPAPEIVPGEIEYFFGTAPNTEIISHDFTLANEGVAPLHISAVRTDCGCVLARLTDDTLDPGESIILPVKFDLKGRAGKQIRRIIVESNDPDQPRLVLALIGEALAPVEIIPDRIYWGNIHVAAQIEKSCEIRFHERDETYINAVISPDPAFTAELITVKPRRVYKVLVRSVPPLPPGPVKATLRLLTDNPRFKTLEIPMLGRITSDIFAIPEEIILDPPSGEPVTRVLLVFSGLKKKFKVIRVELPAPDMKFSIRSAAGGGYRINLSNIMPAKALDGAKIVVVTDSTTMPLLTVPIRVPDAATP